MSARLEILYRGLTPPSETDVDVDARGISRAEAEQIAAEFDCHLLLAEPWKGSGTGKWVAMPRQAHWGVGMSIARIKSLRATASDTYIAAAIGLTIDKDSDWKKSITVPPPEGGV